MPIAELLGVQFDMQLLLKLSISAAAVLLVSWAYKFYNSRDKEKIQLGDKKAHSATCQNCKTTLRSSPICDDDEGGGQPGHTHSDSDTNDLPAHGTEETSEETQSHKSENAFSISREEEDDDMSTKEELLAYQMKAEAATSNISVGSTLDIPDPAESGTVRTAGRRSPCFLQKLDGAVGVSRELRQDLEHQGTYSTFLSKAEIKVEDASVVQEETGDQIVRGKIYDYYVESSSHTVTDSNQYERNSELQPLEFGSRGSSPTESPSTPSSIIMRDLDLSQSAAEDPSSLSCHKLRRPARPALLRKESYLSAAEQCELPIPFVNSTASTPIIHSLAPPSNKPPPIHPLITPCTDSKGPDASKIADLETVAGAPFLHLPAKTPDGTDLEFLSRKLDLGNCLEVLHLAKKHGQTSVEQAALQVMSDNYLQVLRDPNIYGQLMAGERERIQRQRTEGRKFIMVADMDPHDWTRNTGGQAAETEPRRTTSSTVYYYDDYTDSWQTLCVIPKEAISKDCAMCTLDNYLFVAVGCQGTDREMVPSKRVFCYNPLTSIWKEISPMNEARPRCKLVSVGGSVYAIGGECLSSVERYDPRLDRWTFVAPLPNDTFAVAHHVTVCNGEIFVCGGTLKCMLLRYNPKTNTWRTGTLVGGRDRAVDMIAVGSFLYRFDVNPRLGISVYRYHTVARLWYECTSKRLLHCPSFLCARMDGNIYCVSRQFTMRFDADEVSPAFTEVDLSVLAAAKGILFPFVLSLPDQNLRQTSV